MDDLNMEKQEYEKMAQMVMDAMQKSQKDNENAMQEILEAFRQMQENDSVRTYASTHPVHTVLNEGKESVQNAIKWAGDKINELDNRIMEYTEKMKDAVGMMKGAALDRGEAALVTVQQSYQNAIDRLTAAKEAVVEFRDSLVQKTKDLAHKPVDAFKDGVSHIKEFIENTKAKLNEKIAKVFEDNAKGHEAMAERVTNFGKNMHAIGQDMKKLFNDLAGKTTVEKPYKEPKFIAKWRDNLLAAAKEDRDMATKFNYKAISNHIKADVQADNRAFRDVGFER